MTMTGPVGVVSHVIDTLVCAFLSEGRVTTVGGMPSVSVDSAACLGSATAAFPVDKKVKTRKLTDFICFESEHTAKTIPPAPRCQM